MPLSATLTQLCALEGHSDRVWYLAWSPTGDCLASCSGDATVRLWAPVSGSSTTWTCIQTLEGSHTGTVRSCCWSPDGHCLATASFDKTVVIWSCFDGVWESVSILEGHESEVKSVAWNMNGSLLATCGRDKTVWFWESQPQEDFDVVDVKHGHSQDVKSVAWHPHGELLASVSYDNSIKLWMESEDEWICVKTLEGQTQGHSSTVWDVCFDKDGEYMATCSDDLSIKIWSLTLSHESVECRLEKTLSGLHTRTIYSIDWNTDRNCLVTAGADNTITVFSMEKGDCGDVSSESLSVHVELQKHQAHGQDINCVRWRPSRAPSSDGTILASASDDGTVVLWKYEN